MGDFVLTRGGEVATFSDPQLFLTQLSGMLGNPVIVSIPRAAAATFRALADLLKRSGYEVLITADSEQAALDYAINGFSGGALGAATGTLTTAGLIAFAAQYGRYVPYVGWVISIGAVLGGALGVAAGLQTTRMGVRLKLSPLNPAVVDLELMPIRG